jgi:hypothetical protein
MYGITGVPTCLCIARCVVYMVVDFMGMVPYFRARILMFSCVGIFYLRSVCCVWTFHVFSLYIIYIVPLYPAVVLLWPASE